MSTALHSCDFTAVRLFLPTKAVISAVFGFSITDFCRNSARIKSNALGKSTLARSNWYQLIVNTSTIATLVMKQLVMTKENSERRKAMRMGQALSTFIDGKAPPTYAKTQGIANWSKDSHRNQTEQPSPRSLGANGHADSGIDNIGTLELNDRSPGHDETSTIQNGSRESFASLDLSTLEKAEPNTGQGQEERSVLFARASFLMKDALEATGW
jgi:hypothetical protein